MAGDRSAQVREEDWLEEGRRAAVEGWSYDRSQVRPGSRPALVWHEYPLASVWVVAVTGLHESERGVAVWCGHVPVALGTHQRTVAEALELAARHLEDAARDADREYPRIKERIPGYPNPETTKGWRDRARRLLERAREDDVRALAIGPAERR